MKLEDLFDSLEEKLRRDLGNGNMDEALKIVQDVYNHIVSKGVVTMAEMYREMQLPDIPLYLAVRILVVYGDVWGPDPYAAEGTMKDWKYRNILGGAGENLKVAARFACGHVAQFWIGPNVGWEIDEKSVCPACQAATGEARVVRYMEGSGEIGWMKEGGDNNTPEDDGDIVAVNVRHVCGHGRTIRFHLDDAAAERAYEERQPCPSCQAKADDARIDDYDDIPF